MDARTRGTAAIDGAIDQALAERRIVGGVGWSRRDGEIICRQAAGLADREAAVPMREEAVFRLASLTKPLVTAAALRMVELGKIALADPVARYLPAFRPALPMAKIPTITLRHLLTHTAGLVLRFPAAAGWTVPYAAMFPRGRPAGPHDGGGARRGLRAPGSPIAPASGGPIRWRWMCLARRWKPSRADLDAVMRVRERDARRSTSPASISPRSSASGWSRRTRMAARARAHPGRRAARKISRRRSGLRWALGHRLEPARVLDGDLIPFRPEPACNGTASDMLEVRRSDPSRRRARSSRTKASPR